MDAMSLSGFQKPVKIMITSIVRPFVSLHVAQSPSGEAQLYLPNITPRVPRSVHAKFHAEVKDTDG